MRICSSSGLMREEERHPCTSAAARRLWIRSTDLILVMQNGNIVESGTHEVLLARGGLYATLYNSQFEPQE